MVVIHVQYITKPKMREEFVREVKKAGILEATEAEEGNHYYKYFYSVDNEDEIKLLECWDGNTAIQAHLKTDHAQKLQEMKKKYVLSTTFHIYKVIEK